MMVLICLTFVHCRVLTWFAELDVKRSRGKHWINEQFVFELLFEMVWQTN